ncbi:Uu.00g009400.m01.CDS01 [Anthostomella pinea]|uniref:Uu.00g009400.m01.CDS01 n=1 Tax=Anthostomella pinea TaxID=933095 RepID=A0AAI8VRM5_9PEZI|nr:Uu.00g009400.m01.CDS01 [Anthostomella pinea]
MEPGDGSAAVAKRLQTYFSEDKRYVLYRSLPSGASGDCRGYIEDFGSGRTRKFVVKWPNDDDETVIDGLRNEIAWLQVLRFAEHIVSPLPISTGKELPKDVYIFLEYMENGTLSEFLERIGSMAIPNRILWSLFLCLIRACVSMAWPPAAGQPEEVKPGPPSRLSHWDMHDENLMFGQFNTAYLEHRFIPILKLIDFDNATLIYFEEKPDADVVAKFDNDRESQHVTSLGASANVLDVGIAMTRMLAQHRFLDVGGCREAIQHEYPTLDFDLQLLVVRCLAAEPKNRPSLEELLRVAFTAVATKAFTGETDEVIQQIIQAFILDGNQS